MIIESYIKESVVKIRRTEQYWFRGREIRIDHGNVVQHLRRRGKEMVHIMSTERVDTMINNSRKAVGEAR